MEKLLTMMLLVLFLLAQASPVVVDFENVQAILQPNDKANRVEEWEVKGVKFRLAHPPKSTKGKGMVMFFEHIASGRKGIGNAMALEAIPVRAALPQSASSVTVSFWGSTAVPAILEAYDANGKLLDRAQIPSAPLRKGPADPEPVFTLSVKANGISYVEFSGPRPGEFLAARDLSYVPERQ
jgi:hypothetical protein